MIGSVLPTAAFSNNNDVAVFALLLTCIFCCGAGLFLLPMSSRRGLLPAGGLSSLIALGTLLAILPESYSLTNRASVVQRKLPLLEANGNFPAATVIRYVPAALWTFTLCLLGLLAGEAWQVLRDRPDHREAGGPDAVPSSEDQQHVRTFVSMAVPFAVACILIVRHGHVLNLSVIAHRGSAATHGQGIATVGTWLAPASAVLLLSCRHAFRPVTRWALVALSLGVTLTSGTRTPLIFVASYAATVALRRIGLQRTRLKTLAISVVGAYCVIILISGINIWRGQLINHSSKVSLPAALATAAANPIASLPSSGAVNTLDGAVFVRILHAERHVNASPANWSVAGALFVPSQLWPHKPQPLSAVLSNRYLGFGVSGIFLSGPGYTWLTGYGTPGSIVIWFLVGTLVASACGRRSRTPAFSPLWQSLIVFFLVQIWFAGDTFSAYYVGSIAVAVWIFYRLAGSLAMPRSAEPPHTGSAAPRAPSRFAAATAGDAGPGAKPRS